MVKKSVIAVIVVAGVLFAYFYFASDEAKIRREFKNISKWASRERNDSKIETAARVNQIRALFDDECRFASETYGFDRTYTRQDISSRTFSMMSQNLETELNFYDLSVDVAGDGTARATATADFIVTRMNGERILDTHEIDCRMIKKEGEWLFKEIVLVQILER